MEAKRRLPQRRLRRRACSLCAQYGVKVNMGITRHSLLSADDAAVTCFDVNLPEGAAEEAFRTACTQAFAEGGADAGVCVLPILMEDSEDGLHEDIAAHADKRRVDKIKRDYEEMIRFGQQARLRPVTEDEARQSAGAFERVLLEDNGNGVKGMIGALADPWFSYCAQDVERYHDAVAVKGRQIIREYDRSMTESGDFSKIAEADRKLCEMAKEETDKTLGRILGTSSVRMKNNSRLSDN